MYDDDPLILHVPDPLPERRLFCAVLLQSITMALKDGKVAWFRGDDAAKVVDWAGFDESLLPRIVAFIEDMRAKGRFHLLGRNHNDADYAAMLAGIARRGEAVKASYKTLSAEAREACVRRGREGGGRRDTMRGAET